MQLATDACRMDAMTRQSRPAAAKFGVIRLLRHRMSANLQYSTVRLLDYFWWPKLEQLQLQIQSKFHNLQPPEPFRLKLALDTRGLSLSRFLTCRLVATQKATAISTSRPLRATLPRRPPPPPLLRPISCQSRLSLSRSLVSLTSANRPSTVGRRLSSEFC